MKINPTNDRVLVEKPEEEKVERKSAGGILIPDTIKSDKKIGGAEVYNVVAVGPTVSMIQPGDKVVLGGFCGTELEVEGRKYTILNEKDILGVIS